MGNIERRILNDIRHIDSRDLAGLVGQLLKLAHVDVIEYRETKLDSRGFPYDIVRYELKKRGKDQ